MKQDDIATAFRRHVLPEARHQRNDVVVLEGDRGGIELRVLSYLDVLLESDIITLSQAQYGRNFWSVRDTSFHELQTKISKCDYRSEDHDGQLQEIEDVQLAEPGMATEIMLALRRIMAKDDIEVVSAACHSLDRVNMANKMAIVWAFGENRLIWAFEALEAKYTKAKEDAEERVRKTLAYEKENA